jgi:hypothetical protein
MSHCDPTTLALAALGEDIPADESAHLSHCAQCLADAAELTELVAVAREAPATLPDVPDRVWTGIRAELGLDRAPDGGNTRILALAPPPASGPEGHPELPANVVPLRPRWGRLLAVGGVAAAAGALVGGAVVHNALDSGSPDRAPAETLVAQAVLNPLQAEVASSGQAEVLNSEDGQVVRVDARTLPERSGFYEVWLLDEGVTKLVALGALPAGSVGTFTIPPGVAIEDFPILDISLEPLDGDPAHSKESLLRGTLST